MADEAKLLSEEEIEALRSAVRAHCRHTLRMLTGDVADLLATLDQRTRERDEARAEVRRWIDRCKQERGRVDHFHAWVRELERCQCRRSAGTKLRKGSGVVVCVSCGRIAPAVGTRDTGGGDE